MYVNPSASTWRSQYTIDPAVLAFHKNLPQYNQTPLHCLPKSFSDELDVGPVFLKDESHRFGLPAYKIAGASWGCYRAVCKHLDLPPTTSIEKVTKIASAAGVCFYTATDGNWGRAVARMGSMLGAKSRIYVPKVMIESTREKIRLEGGTVIVVDGVYDLAVKMAEKDSIDSLGLLIEDTAWPGYEKIPQWVVEGYSTIMTEIDEQVQAQVGKAPDVVVVPIGVGSLGQATVAHFKSRAASSAILAVEPDTAACLQTSLKKGEMTTVETADTPMCGMNCGTVSMLAWPILRDGVDASITVTDAEAKQALDMLTEIEINVGPCAAAMLAALIKSSKQGKESSFRVNADSVIVLLGTEGSRGPDFDMS
ncbi:hypothetical protein ACLMJK_008149 [Lecanora helva]